MNDTPTDALAEFITGMTALVEATQDERTLLAQGRQLLSRLIESDQWLPADCARALPDRYAQYLLHTDRQQRFSVVSFVWGPGQQTPVHDHTVWGLVGMLRGAERCEEFEVVSGIPQATGKSHLMRPGQIEAVSPTVGDWHRVSNALEDLASISIHVYGADIGTVRRHYLNAEGQVAEFVSGYTAR
jgi:predicted metal-dependent enzyme (double-stranded beta helix superfamily)